MLRTLIILLGLGPFCACAGPAPVRPAEKRPVSTATAQGGWIEASGVRFWLTPPKGWLLDRDFGRARGLAAVLYPRGEGPTRGEAVMFVTVRAGAADLGAAILAEKERIAGGSAVLVISEAEPQTTANGRWMHIRIFEGSAEGPQARAFVEEAQGLVVFGLRTRSPDAFAFALPAFEALLASYNQR